MHKFSIVTATTIDRTDTAAKYLNSAIKYQQDKNIKKGAYVSTYKQRTARHGLLKNNKNRKQ